MKKQSIITRVKRLTLAKIRRRFRFFLTQITNRIYCFIGFRYPSWIDSIPTYMTLDEKMCLFRLASRLPNGAKIVEIGSYHGASSAVLASAAKGRNIEVYCIDTWMNDAVRDPKEDIMEIFLKNVKPVKESIRIIRGFSYDKAKEINFSIDLLFIDGDHSYEGVKTDLTLYLDKIREGGVLAMHDMAAYSVKRAFDDFAASRIGRSLFILPNFFAGTIKKLTNETK